MQSFELAISVALFSVFSFVGAQAPGPSNTNPDCDVGGRIDIGATYYYAAADAADVGVYLSSTGMCDEGSYAEVQLLTSSGNIVPCGYLSLDANEHLISCQDQPRGAAVAGNYEFQVLIQPGAYAYADFSITHSQETETAATPTQTVTITPSKYS